MKEESKSNIMDSKSLIEFISLRTVFRRNARPKSFGGKREESLRML